MNPNQIKAHTAGFLHALAMDPKLAAEFQSSISNERRAQIVAEYLGLAHPPSVSDLQAMANYAKENLADAAGKAQTAAVTPMVILFAHS